MGQDLRVNAVAVIQARLGSSRLPNKALATIPMRDASEPSIVSTVRRVVAVGIPVVGAVPERDLHTLGELMASAGCTSVFGGAEHDVLHRVHEAAQGYDAIMRVTGDCPLWCPDIGKQMLRVWEHDRAPGGAGWDYVTNDTTKSGWPDGTDTEVFSAEALHEAHKRANRPGDREHVTPWIRDTFPVQAIFTSPRNYKEINLSVDTEDDLTRVRSVARHLYRKQVAWPHLLHACYTVGLVDGTD